MIKTIKNKVSIPLLKHVKLDFHQRQQYNNVTTSVNNIITL